MTNEPVNARDVSAWISEAALVTIGIVHPSYLPEVVPLLVATFLGHGAIMNSIQQKTQETVK